MQHPRVEREYRFLLSSRQAHELVAVASQHLRLDVYERDGPIAYTRTTYYDTPDGQYWRDEQSGTSRRVRIRQYAAAPHCDSPPVLVGKAYLEFKESIGSVREKVRFVSAPTELLGILGAAQISADASLRLQATPQLRALATSIRECRLRPMFSTWYRRVSLSKDRVRMTIDENISLCPPQDVGLAGEPAAPSGTVASLPGRVLELKVLGEMPAWLTTAVASLSGTETFSKFRWGMQRMASPSTSRLATTCCGTRPLALLAPLRARRSP